MSGFIFLVVLPITPLLVWSTNRLLLSNKLKNLSISLISALLIYIFILVSVAYVENKLNSDLATFDLNGDGFFSGSELTPDQEKAMYRVTADTGRRFAPFTGVIFSFIYFLGVWLMLSVFSWVGRWRSRRNT